jgi:DhnA family fructose-bisphosphate aldolase class Ia
VLGGEKVHTDGELLTMIKESIEAGAAGVVIGRNIWRRPNVKNICSAIAKIIHENSSVDKALEELL